MKVVSFTMKTDEFLAHLGVPGSSLVLIQTVEEDSKVHFVIHTSEEVLKAMGDYAIEINHTEDA